MPGEREEGKAQGSTSVDIGGVVDRITSVVVSEVVRLWFVSCNGGEICTLYTAVLYALQGSGMGKPTRDECLKFLQGLHR